MNILGTGLSGLIGTRIIELLSPHWLFENLSLETGIDITRKKTVDEFVSRTDSPWIFHFAAYTDVDGAEKERGVREEGTVWKINVSATEFFVEACRKSGKHLLYMSTDYVFDGTKGQYTEEDTPNPLGWYAVTKYEGEKRVLSLGDKALIVRTANPYRANPSGKKDFVHRIINTLSSGQEVKAPTDQFIIPTYIDDIAYAIQTLVDRNEHGIYHVVGSQVVTPYAAAVQIARTFGLKEDLIIKTTFREYFSERSNRPFRANLKNDKITKLGISMKSFDEGLKEVYKEESPEEFRDTL